MRQRILICEESNRTAGSVTERMAQSGFVVESVIDEAAASLRLQDDPRPTILVPARRQEAKGQCAVIRRVSDVPVVVVLPSEGGGSKANVSDIEACLEVGADVVMTSALGRRELAARVAAAARRDQAGHAAPADRGTSRCGELTIDATNHSVTRAGKRIALTPTEFRLLRALVQRAGRLATHEELIGDIWGPSSQKSPKMLRLYVGYLRRKLQAEQVHGPQIVNQRGVGYRLVEAVAS